LGRSAVHRVDSPRSRRTLNGLLIAAVAVVLLFAVVGVVSAGAFVADKISGGKSTPTSRTRVTGTSAAVQDVVRAQAQATAIVKQAQFAGRNIVSSSGSKAHRQAKAIVAAARRQAAAIKQSGAGSSTVAPTAPVTQPQTAPTALVTQPQTAPSALPTAQVAAGATSGSLPSTGNLSGYPSSWQVVAHKITFGSGPGSAGNVTVTNRSSVAHSGEVTVQCTAGGSAQASFNALPPGQSELIPLNGRECPGGRYSVPVFSLR